MADWPGAVAAIKARLAGAGLATPIAQINEPPPPTTDGSGNLVPWLLLEVVGAGSAIRGVGRPGSHVTHHDGLILVHVMVPTGSATEAAFSLAWSVGQVFRTSVFYNSDPGSELRCWTPRIDGGGSGDEDGNWFRVTVTIPFVLTFLA